MRAAPAKDTLVELGLWGWPAFYRDGLFWLAVLAGAGVSVALAQAVSPPRPALGPWLAISVVLWQPFWEELFFRALVQGQLLARPWARRRGAGISIANVLTSLLFVALHFIYHPPAWALAVFVPSLVFGLFRERHNSVYPALVLHCLYNAFYLFIVV